MSTSVQVQLSLSTIIYKNFIKYNFRHLSFVSKYLKTLILESYSKFVYLCTNIFMAIYRIHEKTIHLDDKVNRTAYLKLASKFFLVLAVFFNQAALRKKQKCQ